MTARWPAEVEQAVAEHMIRDLSCMPSCAEEHAEAALAVAVPLLAEHFAQAVEAACDHHRLADVCLPCLHAARAVREAATPTDTRHNHFTRDIKAPGKCPACDRHHAQAATPNEPMTPDELGPLSGPMTDEEFTMRLDMPDVMRGCYCKTPLMAVSRPCPIHTEEA
jgi:hypothetical protein